jgi:hypothetical protein
MVKLGGTMSIKDNLRAIAILKNLQIQNLEPSKEEKQTLSKFNGWGAMWEIFKPDHRWLTTKFKRSVICTSKVCPSSLSKVK